MFESMSIDLVERILKELPVNIFFKDKNCKYVFSSHYWSHVKQDGSKNWDIKGKSSADVRMDGQSEANHSYEQDRRIIETGEPVSYVTALNNNGKKEYIEVIKCPVRDDNNEVIGIVGIVTDITKRKELEQQLEIYAQTDMLTGLYNRRYLEFWMKERLMKEMFPVGVISADCDGLKKINDTYGHHAGDELIRNTTSLFRVCLPEQSVLFRMGGDEFLILLPNTDLVSTEEYVKTMQKASGNMKIFGNPLSVSFGTAVYDDEQIVFEDIIRRADKRMYEDKQRRKAGREQ